MDQDFKSFIINKATNWFQQNYGHHQVTVVLDERQPADVYGENVLAWYVELLSDALPTSIGVEVAIDPDGCVATNRIEPNVLRLQHLWPHP